MIKINKQIQQAVKKHIERNLGDIEKTKKEISEVIYDLSEKNYAYGNKNQILYYTKWLFQIEKLEENANN